LFALKSRFTQGQAANILKRSGWDMTGHYESANKPVAAICRGCGKAGMRRVGDTHAKLKEGIRQFGCMACVRKKFSHPKKVSLKQGVREFREEKIDYLDGWKGEQYPVRARCGNCGHEWGPSLKHVRAGHGCPRCHYTGFWSVSRLLRDPVLAARPAMLYVVEFLDRDTETTVFHKVGIGTLDGMSRPRGGGCDRLYRHYLDGAQLVSSVEADLLTCLIAEQIVLRRVACRAYTPTANRIRGGDTECFLPGELIDLRRFLKLARAANPMPSLTATGHRL
jgi:hypothetical protein